MTPNSSKRWVNILFWVWYALFLPWIPLAFVSAMAFDGGYTIQAYVFAACVYTYPIVVLIAAALYHRSDSLVLLPCLNLLGIVAVGFK